MERIIMVCLKELIYLWEIGNKTRPLGTHAINVVPLKMAMLSAKIYLMKFR
jgi:hypothetical protein